MESTHKAAIINTLQSQIVQLQNMLAAVEHSTLPDLHGIEALPELLATRREKLALLPSEIADLSGLSPTTYRALEKPDSNPRLETLVSVGKVLNFKLWIELL